MFTPSLIVAALAALGILVLFIGLARTLGAEQEVIESRLGRYTQRGFERAATPGGGERERTFLPFVAGLEKVISRQSFAERMSTELARADLKLTVTEWLLFYVISIVIGLIIGLILFRDALGLVGAVFGFVFPNFYLRRRQGQRLRSFNNQLGDAIVLLANSLRSGYSLLQSMETLSAELPPPISDEFRRVVREIGLGLSTDQALDNLLRRINSGDLDLMITAVKIQHEVGGNLAEILETIGETIRERVRLEGEIRALTALQRGTGTLLTFLPVGLGMVLYAMNRPYISLLFTDPCGQIMLGIAAFGVIVGGLAIHRLSKIEV
ncbi:MAG: type II secretion system F family protein [Chloroflexi bacterium]|nr:type II secretion system F family protein [Chloroflexota bacterium]